MSGEPQLQFVLWLFTNIEVKSHLYIKASLYALFKSFINPVFLYFCDNASYIAFICVFIQQYWLHTTPTIYQKLF